MAFSKKHKDAFGSSVGQLVARATIGTLSCEDWERFLHVCDVINVTADGPRQAVEALKERIRGNRNYREVRLALSLLALMVRRCRPELRQAVFRREFVRDVLAKVLKPKYNPPIDVQSHILSLIQLWATSFQGGVDVSEVQQLFMEMKGKGMIFPAPGSLPAGDTGAVSDRATAPPTSPGPQQPSPLLTPVTLKPEQVGKLHSELDMVEMNIKVMSEILLQNVPGSENAEDMELLQKLLCVCDEMGERVTELLIRVVDGDMMVRLLHVNKELNNVLLRYHRFKRSQVSLARNSEREAPPQTPSSEPSAPCSVNNLIDFRFSSAPGLLPIAGLGIANAAQSDQPVPSLPTHSPGSECPSATQQQMAGAHWESLYSNVSQPEWPTLTPANTLTPICAPSHTELLPASHRGSPRPGPWKPTAAELIAMEFDPLVATTTESIPDVINKSNSEC